MTSTSPQLPPGSITVHVFGRTDVGRTREHNEDTFVISDLTSGHTTLRADVRTHTLGERGTLLMVADGMGGAAAGEVASAMATEVVLEELDARWRRAATATPETFVLALKAATESANARINRYATEHPENRGMGTTATIAGLLNDQVYVAQVGDSRAYLVRNGTALQITKDQSLMQKLVEAGELTVEEAEVSERRNIILQALGPEPMVKVDLTQQQLRRGDVLVLCSDGLSGQVRASEIADVVAKNSDLLQVCKQLIDLANESGGPDNITVIAARLDGEGLLPPESEEHVGHRVYGEERVLRPTVRVNSADIAAAVTGEMGDLPDEASTRTTDELPTPRAARVSGGVARESQTPLRKTPPGMSAVPEPGAAEPRVSVGTLRIIFGVLALGIAAWLIYRFRR